MDTSVVARGRSAFLDHFRWDQGHADVWAPLQNGVALASIVDALAEPFHDQCVDAVIGVEARGFLLGGAVAVALGVGFVPVRKAGSLFPGDKVSITAEPDYRGISHELRVQRASITPGSRLVMVDDWIERGSQARAVRDLVTQCEASLIAISVLVDDVAPDIRSRIGEIHSLVTFAELPLGGGKPDDV